MGFKSKAVQIAGSTGVFQMCRLMSRSTPKILMYHRFSEKPKEGYVDRVTFERQVNYLKNNFYVVTLSKLVSHYLKTGSFIKNAAVITVDDGYRDFYDIAYPVLKKSAVPATFFITTKFVDGDFWLWPDSIRYILDCSNEVDLHAVSSDLKYAKTQITGRDRQVLWDKIVTFLLSIPENEKKQWIADFSKFQEVELPNQPIDDYSAVSWSQVQELNTKNIEIGVHTKSHPSLGRLTEDRLSAEILGAVETIQNHLRQVPTSFCFPNGQPVDYTESAKKHVKNSGCTSAVTAFYDEHMVDDLYELRRFFVGTDWQYFLRVVNGVDVLAAQWFKTNNIIQLTA